MFLDNFQLRLDKPEKIKERKAFGGHKKTKGIKIKTGLYAWNSLGIHTKITTRPGQVGMCNGYVLEGEELETFLNSREDLGLAPPNQSAAK
ncbi:hypothetical protein P5673_017209 [Acropora cervicornis]|uniref:Transposase n=1 Tax=Acropora cervicornis TaxID=6130 RepID=A0AAD9QFX9_ACRCE|nr:hypothetical protein P5673_017209 [Acropora cervicornis]